MSLNSIKFSDKLKTDSKVDCHLIACRVKANCEANVDKYFNPTISECDKQKSVLLSSFRGRPLIGRKVELPENCSAFVLHKSKNSEESIAKESFKQITYWNLDKFPSDSDSLPQAIQWINISNAIHSPISSKTSSKKC